MTGMRRSGRWCCLALLLSWTPAFSGEILKLSVEQAVELAVEHHLGLRRAQLNTRIRTAGVALEEARFGRRLTGGLFHQAERSPSISRLEAVQNITSNRQSLDLGVVQELSGGGRLSLDFGNNRSSSNAAFRTIDPVYNSSLTMSFSQPLLQGRGVVNRIGLELAHHELEGAQADLDSRLRLLRAEVGLAYWQLFFAQAELEVKEQLRVGAQRVLEAVRVQAELGVSAHSGILAAEVGVARREEEIVVAEGLLQAAEDRLKTRCGLDRTPATQALQLALVDTPVVEPFEGRLEEGIDQALAASAAYRQAELLLKNLDLQIELALDRLRPAIELSARAGLTGTGATYRDDLEGLGKSDGRSWGGGLNLNFPLGQTADDARYRQRLLEKQRQAIDLEDLGLQIAQQVRDQHRQLQVNRRRIEVAGAAVGLAVQQVDDQETRLGLGLSTVREVLDVQDELARARGNLLQAIVDYTSALIRWRQLTGS